MATSVAPMRSHAPASSAAFSAFSLPFQIELPTGDSMPGRDTAASIGSARARLESVKERLEFFTKPSDAFTTKLHREVSYYVRKMERDGEPLDSVLLATSLCKIGFDVSVRSALGPNAKATGGIFTSLRYECMCVQGSGDYEGSEFIVDLYFRQQFSIPHPTPAYLEVLESLPEIFVGAPSRLVPVVHAMAAEMAAAFAERDMTLPPWRKPASLLSKWIPTKSRDVAVGSNGRPAAPAQGMAQPRAVRATSAAVQLPSSAVATAPRPLLTVPAAAGAHKVTFGFAL